MRDDRIYLNVFTPKPGKLDDLADLQMAETSRLGPISAEYGWLGNEIYRSDEKLVIVTRFASDEQTGAWQQTAEFAQHLDLLDPALEQVDSTALTLLARNRAPDAPIRLAVITGSTREGRFSDQPANWIAGKAADHGGFAITGVDLRDHDLPFFGAPHASDAQRRAADAFVAMMQGFDAYILTVAEYNHAPTAVLKNALDHLDAMRKPVAFVAYGGVGGARAVEHLRAITAELRMVAVRDAVHITYADLKPLMAGEATLGAIPHLENNATIMLDELAWWARLLRDAEHPA
ncbi:NADPH-dependent FMN reductase [Paracoccus aurantiacus]|uniref:NADPH-dependent FMN reductase n=1 Tax=Paracoccus aurantiacus TaxID=2599412 RepID=A0A5C6S5B1_9RHOB|nr:NAD(P)H-dependent oxidoreductase [Paracoccus aurantiacus]TXB69625.1 NADPH-dependent FMN reductase [Paracoccus aurantiacus]